MAQKATTDSTAQLSMSFPGVSLAVSFSDGAIHCMKFNRFPAWKPCARGYFK
jgi:hypothetical protein